MLEDGSSDNVSIGDLRFDVPQPIGSYVGTIDATVFGNLCINFNNETGPEPPWMTPQMEAYLGTLDAIPASSTFSEDCASSLARA